MIQKIAAVIPAFNEEYNIVSVIRAVNSLSNKDFEVIPIIINDCSTDGTSFLARKENCIVLDLPVNLGIGGAVQTGYIYAFHNNYDYAVQIDGDGQHPAEEVVKLFYELKRNDLDVVIGSRFILKKGFQSTFLRRMGIRYFTILNKFLLGIRITDCTSGLRLINKRTLNLVCQYYPDEYPEPESIVFFKLNNLKIKEVPVTMMARSSGVSSIRFLSSLYYMVKVSLAIFYTYLRLKFKKFF